MKLLSLLSILVSAASFRDGFLFTEGQHDALQAHLSDLEGCKTEYKVDGQECGELCLSSTIASFAEKFGGVTEGSCKDIGYTVFDHQETVSMGPFGESTVDIYVKPSATV